MQISGDYLVHSLGFVFRNVLAHVEHLEFKRFRAEDYLDKVSLLDVIRRLDLPAVYNDVLAVAGIVCHSSALDYARDLKKFIYSHFLFIFLFLFVVYQLFAGIIERFFAVDIALLADRCGKQKELTDLFLKSSLVKSRLCRFGCKLFCTH